MVKAVRALAISSALVPAPNGENAGNALGVKALRFGNKLVGECSALGSPESPLEYSAATVAVSSTNSTTHYPLNEEEIP